MFSRAFLFLFLFFLAQCHCTKESGASAQNSINKNSVEGVSPGKCRMIATILKTGNLDSSDTSNYCSKAPCRAYLKINKILAYGSSFPTEVTAGAEIEAFFPNTLTPHLIKIKSTYPDLKTGDRIQALLESRIQPSNDPLFIINDYQLK